MLFPLVGCQIVGVLSTRSLLFSSLSLLPSPLLTQAQTGAVTYQLFLPFQCLHDSYSQIAILLQTTLAVPVSY